MKLSINLEKFITAATCLALVAAPMAQLRAETEVSSPATEFSWQAGSQNRRTRTLSSGDNFCVNSVAFSPNGRFGLSGSRDETVRLWDISNGNFVRDYNLHNAEVTSIAYSKDGKYMVSGI